jgi:hypothetical protein
MGAKHDVEDLTAWRFECPVCGIELVQSNFDTPAIDYYCPFCTTRQTPQRRAIDSRGLSGATLRNVERVSVGMPLVTRRAPGARP